ncbi:hypothetical protein FN846DRAFT_646918 [Sphaerosporella brunnea]|uniref:Uncharacterized protein n=1 Tax=Sphaerosporella brunnea TaxID=1250544 RepID=A0A5J5F0B1_9PEZI|nr:hypothetical protein FN846DRAFT_646918 [Sphaerosporella brunnea]
MRRVSRISACHAHLCAIRQAVIFHFSHSRSDQICMRVRITHICTQVVCFFICSFYTVTYPTCFHYLLFHCITYHTILFFFFFFFFFFWFGNWVCLYHRLDRGLSTLGIEWAAVVFYPSVLVLSGALSLLTRPVVRFLGTSSAE